MKRTTTVHFPPPDVCWTYCGFDFAEPWVSNGVLWAGARSVLDQTRRKPPTESIECRDYVPLLPESILLQAMLFEAVHLGLW